MSLYIKTIIEKNIGNQDYVIAMDIDGKIHNLYTNMSENFLSDGYKNLDSFKKEFLPEFTYKVKDIKITKTISKTVVPDTRILLRST